MINRTLMVLVVAILLSQRPAPNDGDWRWLQQARSVALDRLMPMTDVPGRGLIAYRSYRDLYHDAHERHFIIVHQERDDYTATLTTPIDTSIQQQLLDFHMSDRAASIDSLLPRVRVRRITVDSSRCPSLVARLGALANVSMPVPRDIVVLHPVVHRVVLYGTTARIDATLSESELPLVQWATETADAIQQCQQR